MVSKSIRKPSKKHNFKTIEIIIQGDPKTHLVKNCEVPRFLDPVNCYHLYGDICFAKANYNDGDDEIGLLSNYNHFKRVVKIGLNSNYISISLEKTSDQIHSWEFLFSRLSTLNNLDAHELIETMKAIQIQPNDTNQSQKPDYTIFCKELDTYCKENAENFYSLFRFRMGALEKGLELTEIRHSKKTMQFFADDVETFAHLVLEQGIIDIWDIEEKNYFSYMKDSLTNYFGQTKKMGIYACTMEGFKVYINPEPFRRMFSDGTITEIVVIANYEIDEIQMQMIKNKREDTKKRIKKSFREKQLQQTLGIYYNNYQEEGGEEMKQPFIKKGVEEGYENNNVFLAEKKRCGIKPLN